jgi:hypothetical protein
MSVGTYANSHGHSAGDFSGLSTGHEVSGDERSWTPMALDHDSCVSLLIREHVKLVGYVRAIVGDVHTAEDVLQQVAVLVLRKSNDIRDADHFLAWMRRAARLEALNAAHKSKRQPLTLDSVVSKNSTDRLPPDISQAPGNFAPVSRPTVTPQSGRHPKRSCPENLVSTVFGRSAHQKS